MNLYRNELLITWVSNREGYEWYTGVHETPKTTVWTTSPVFTNTRMSVNVYQLKWSVSPDPLYGHTSWLHLVLIFSVFHNETHCYKHILCPIVSQVVYFIVGTNSFWILVLSFVVNVWGRRRCFVMVCDGQSWNSIDPEFLWNHGLKVDRSVPWLLSFNHGRNGDPPGFM